MVVKHEKQAKSFERNYKHLSTMLKKNINNKINWYNFKFIFMTKKNLQLSLKKEVAVG